MHVFTLFCVFIPLFLYGTTAVVLDFAKYNDTNEDSYVLKENVSLEYSSTINLEVTNIPSEVGFMIIESHLYLNKAKLTNLQDNTYNYGSDVGLVLLNNGSSNYKFLVSNYSNTSKTVLLVGRAYSKKAPIPGGCNMEYPGLKIAPFSVINASDSDFLRFNIQPPSYPNTPCELSNRNVTTELYLTYFESDNLETNHFEALQRFITVKNIIENGRLVKSESSSSFEKYFYSYFKQGAIITAIVRSGDISVPYVSSVTYFCDPFGEMNNCNASHNIFVAIIVAIFGISGFLYTFSKFDLELIAYFTTTWICVDLLLYIGLMPFLPTGWWLICIMFVSGLLGSLLVFWLFLKSNKKEILILSHICLVFIIYICILTLMTYVYKYNNGWFYANATGLALIFICHALIVLFLPMCRLDRVFLCRDYLGPFALILAIDYFIYGNIHYFVLNIVRYLHIRNIEDFQLPLNQQDTYLLYFWSLLLVWSFLIKKETDFMDALTSRISNRDDSDSDSDSGESRPLLA